MSADVYLHVARTAIDAIDDNILELLVRRAALAESIGHAKGIGLPVNAYYRPDREREILQRLRVQPHGPLLGTEVDAIFRAIMDACLRVQVRQSAPEAQPATIEHHQV